MSDVTNSCEERMKKTIAALKDDFNGDNVGHHDFEKNLHHLVQVLFWIRLK